MRRKIFLALFTLSISFIASSLVAQTQTEKKVMNFIAVMDLKCDEGITVGVCKSLTDVVIDELVKVGTYTVIDRANRDKILSEQGFQQSGCVEESCTVDAGRLLGVGKIVVGSIAKIGSTYLIGLQLVNVQTAAVETSAREECKCELDGLILSVSNAARKLMGDTPTSTPSGQGGTTAPNPITDENGVVVPPPPPGKAVVIIYRLPSALLTPVGYKMVEGDQIIWKSVVRGCFVHIAEPGAHTYKVAGQSKSETTVNLKAGDVQFVELNVTQTGMFPVVRLIKMPTGQGRADILRCKLDAGTNN